MEIRKPMYLRKTLIALALLVALPALADQPPDQIRYDYLDLGVTFGEVDTPGNNPDFTGFGIEGSWGFHRNIALFVGLGAGEIDTSGGNIDTTEASVGINPHFALTPKLDLVIPVALEFAEFDFGPFDDDDTGWSLGVGIRALPNPAWEFGAGIQHVEIFDSDDDVFSGLVRWHINHLFSLGLEVSAGDDSTAGTLTGRFSF
jgi:hypothetical protein